ncbi:nucleoside triphosphate pyrophosphohydrolase [Mycolicibacter minnesotensis]
MTVVLVDPRRPSLIPVEAFALLAGDIGYTEELPAVVWQALPAARPVRTGDDAPVLLSSDRNHPAVAARLAAGAELIAAPDAQAGERLIDAVAVMDRLRTAGPWESEQTHDSLRRFLLEETYELFDAIRGGDAQELCAELGDVLLQVLFHARIAEDAMENPFGIDDVADALLRKLGNRAPAVLAGEEISLAEQMAQWEQRKALEKKTKAAKVADAAQGHDSILDDLPAAQPALALASKVLQRLARAGVPADLIPASVTSVSVAAGVDAENLLRAAVLDLMDTVRAVEGAVAGPLTEQQWRAHWPVR